MTVIEAYFFYRPEPPDEVTFVCSERPVDEVTFTANQQAPEKIIVSPVENDSKLHITY